MRRVETGICNALMGAAKCGQEERDGWMMCYEAAGDRKGNCSEKLEEV